MTQTTNAHYTNDGISIDVVSLQRREHCHSCAKERASNFICNVIRDLEDETTISSLQANWIFVRRLYVCANLILTQ